MHLGCALLTRDHEKNCSVDRHHQRHRLHLPGLPATGVVESKKLASTSTAIQEDGNRVGEPLLLSIESPSFRIHRDARSGFAETDTRQRLCLQRYAYAILGYTDLSTLHGAVYNTLT